MLLIALFNVRDNSRYQNHSFESRKKADLQRGYAIFQCTLTNNFQSHGDGQPARYIVAVQEGVKDGSETILHRGARTRGKHRTFVARVLLNTTVFTDQWPWRYRPIMRVACAPSLVVPVPTTADAEENPVQEWGASLEVRAV